jgi:hypothetical protein
LVLNTDGSFTYTPQQDFNGVDTFTYRASDGVAQSNIATVTFNVAAVNDAPLTSAVGEQTLTENASLSLSGANAIVIGDVDSSNMIEVALSVAHGTLQLSNLTGISFVQGSATAPSLIIRGSLTDVNAALNGLRYVPKLNFVGTDQITYVANDGVDASVQRQIEIQVTPAAVPTLASPIDVAPEVAPTESQSPTAAPHNSAAPTQQPVVSIPAAQPSAREQDGSSPLRNLDIQRNASHSLPGAIEQQSFRGSSRIDAQSEGGKRSPYEALLASLDWQASEMSKADASKLTYEVRRLAAGWHIEQQRGVEMYEEEHKGSSVFSTANMAGVSLSVGVVLWALRAGGLLAALAASTPLWRDLDPLPILGRDDDDEPDEDEQARKDDDVDEREREETDLARVFDHAGPSE